MRPRTSNDPRIGNHFVWHQYEALHADWRRSRLKSSHKGRGLIGASGVDDQQRSLFASGKLAVWARPKSGSVDVGMGCLEAMRPRLRHSGASAGFPKADVCLLSLDRRELGQICHSYPSSQTTASDPIIAVPANHPDASRPRGQIPQCPLFGDLELGFGIAELSARPSVRGSLTPPR